MTTVDTLTNWAGNVTFSPSTVHRPGSVDEVQRLMTRSRHARVLGSGHSFNHLADTPGDLFVLADMPPTLEIDTVRAQVRVAGHLRYGDVMKPLHDAGLALPNTGSLPHISIAGACATGTHGSGDGNPVLAASVAAVEMVTADGSLLTLRRDEPGFDGAVVALGSLGAVTHLTLDLVPAFDVAQVVYEGMKAEVLAERLDEVMAGAYSVSVFTDHRGDARVWQKRISTEAAPTDWLGSRLADGPRHPTPGIDPRHCTAQCGRPGPWFERLPHFELEFTPASGDELQSEYLVPRSQGRAALEIARSLAELMAPVLLISELRSVAADELWLSPAQGRDSLGLHFSWALDPPAVHAVLRQLEPRLAELGVRPHWGKVHTMRGLAELYPRLDDARALGTELDPSGKFANEATAFLR